MSRRNRLSQQLDAKSELNRAISCHQNGQLRPAEQIYRNILEFHPENAEVLHLLGLLTWQTGQCEVAIDLIRQASRIRPEKTLFLRDLARFLNSTGCLNQAIQAYQQALQVDPEDLTICRELAFTLYQADRYDEALQVFQHKLNDNPSDIKFRVELGDFLQSIGRFEDSIRAYQKALSIDTDAYEAYNNLGVALSKVGRFDQSIQACQNAIRIFPNYFEAYNNLGNVYKEMKQLVQAVKSYQEAIRINPEVEEIYFNLGNVFKELDKHEEAIRSYQQVFRLNPNHVEAYYNQGVVLQDQGNFNQAVESYQEAIRINPEYAQAYNNYGFILHKRGKFDEAINQYRRAIDLDPTIAQAHTNLGVALLLTGDFKKGWQEYDWRLKTELSRSDKRTLQYPRWHGCDLASKTILVWAEQGIGDQIMFASVLHLLAQKSQRVVVGIDPRLVAIFQRSFPRIAFFSQFDLPDLCVLGHSIDYQIPIASLGQHFLNTETTFPKQRSYLIPCSEKVQQFEHRYKQLADGRPLIGISWRGGNKEKESRNISLKQWADLIAMRNFCFINLQYGDVIDEINEFTAATGIPIYSDGQVDSSKDLDDFFAQVAAMDLVVSIANSTAHIAGSLGKPALIFLPHVPDWRWMLNRTDSLWYPEITLLRQSREGSWSDVLQQAKTALTQIYAIRRGF